MSLYEQFRTDADSETDGIILDYGDCRIKAARAGGCNKKYAKLLEKKTRAFRKGVQPSEEESRKMLIDIFVESIIKDWQTRVGDRWLSGIENPDGGDLLPVTKENIANTFAALPDLFANVLEQVTTASNFLAARLEEERKN